MNNKNTINIVTIIAATVGALLFIGMLFNYGHNSSGPILGIFLFLLLFAVVVKTILVKIKF
jgi:hypothetical protein